MGFRVMQLSNFKVSDMHYRQYVEHMRDKQCVNVHLANNYIDTLECSESRMGVLEVPSLRVSNNSIILLGQYKDNNDYLKSAFKICNAEGIVKERDM